jgi:hypothetical protein
MIKHCPICHSNDLDYEEDGFIDNRKLIYAISYICNECMAEFMGISGIGCRILFDPRGDDPARIEIPRKLRNDIS